MLPQRLNVSQCSRNSRNLPIITVRLSVEQDREIIAGIIQHIRCKIDDPGPIDGCQREQAEIETLETECKIFRRVDDGAYLVGGEVHHSGIKGFQIRSSSLRRKDGCGRVVGHVPAVPEVPNLGPWVPNTFLDPQYFSGSPLIPYPLHQTEFVSLEGLGRKAQALTRHRCRPGWR